MTGTTRATASESPAYRSLSDVPAPSTAAFLGPNGAARLQKEALRQDGTVRPLGRLLLRRKGASALHLADHHHRDHRARATWVLRSRAHGTLSVRGGLLEGPPRSGLFAELTFLLIEGIVIEQAKGVLIERLDLTQRAIAENRGELRRSGLDDQAGFTRAARTCLVSSSASKGLRSNERDSSARLRPAIRLSVYPDM